MKISFKDFKKELEGIKYKSKKDWELFLPYNTPRDAIQSIIGLCRQHMIIDWHVIFPEPTEEIPEPDTRIYWGENKDIHGVIC